MKKNHGSLGHNTDVLFPWLLFFTLISTISITYYHIAFTGNFHIKMLWKLFPVFNFLILGVACWGILVLGFRLWFAWKYRPYPPLPDRELPKITVIIPAYNEGCQILNTVRSVMNSDYPAEKMQVICVDDGSGDDTWNWMQKAKSEFSQRIQLIRHPFNSGKRHALRSGFKNSKRPVYVTIDSDSEILPDTLRHLVSPFVLDRRVGAVAGNVRVLNIAEGCIPKMLEVSFTCAFDFIRSGQSVYGGVFCTPGALSAYRADVIKPHLTAWINQTFMGNRAAIGEDRALTNLVLSLGYRVIYQRKAMVKTKIPVSYQGLRKMLLRWARSNVRENLVMFSFITHRFRPMDSGSGWIRLFSATQLIRLTIGEGLKFALAAQLLLNPFSTAMLIAVGCLLSALLPSLVYQRQYGTWFGWLWAMSFSFFHIFYLSWISVWGLITANRSGWLTRENVNTPGPKKQVYKDHNTHMQKIFSKAA